MEHTEGTKVYKPCMWCLYSGIIPVPGVHDALAHRMGQATVLRAMGAQHDVDFSRPQWEAIGRLRDRYDREGAW
jgi:hypothetical protein